MVKRDDLVKYIYSYFSQEEIEKAQKFDTHGANGLQVKGGENITGIALGVTADLEFFKRQNKTTVIFSLSITDFVLPKLIFPLMKY